MYGGLLAHRLKLFLFVFFAGSEQQTNQHNGDIPNYHDESEYPAWN